MNPIVAQSRQPSTESYSQHMVNSGGNANANIEFREHLIVAVGSPLPTPSQRSCCWISAGASCFNSKKITMHACMRASIHTAGHVFRGMWPCISVNKTKASIRVWAWFTADGGGSIALLNHLSEKQFLEVVEEELIPHAITRFGTGPVDFINDGSSFDTFNNLIVFKEVKWTAKSYHLSPFATIWSLIEQGIRLQRNQPQNAEQLWDYVNLMWERRSEQPLFWKRITSNLQAKLRSIIIAGGEQTDMEQDNQL